MGATFFGQYLLNQGIINAQQLTKALVLQDVLNKTIGQIALDEKLLTEEQIKQAVDLQKKEDIFFGEALQRLGFLSQEQTDRLLKKQKQNHVYIGDALVTLGYLAEQQREKALADFIREQNENAAMVAPFRFPQIVEHEQQYIEKFTLYTIKLLQRMVHLVAKCDHYAVMEHSVPLEHISIQVNFNGALSRQISRFVLMIPRDTATIIAAKYQTLENAPVSNAVIMDTLRELANMICGQASSNLEEFGELTPKVPEDKSGETHYNIRPNEAVVLTTLITTYGPVSFFLVFLKK
ncbi:MAG: chemotaxis protein CheX [Candidatus Omnitrophica bacterium]|nr:chemotaxis protein CheX [Candidatus Omnitrophota bacterium]